MEWNRAHSGPPCPSGYGTRGPSTVKPPKLPPQVLLGQWGPLWGPQPAEQLGTHQPPLRHSPGARQPLPLPILHLAASIEMLHGDMHGSRTPTAHLADPFRCNTPPPPPPQHQRPPIPLRQSTNPQQRLPLHPPPKPRLNQTRPPSHNPLGRRAPANSLRHGCSQQWSSRTVGSPQVATAPFLPTVRLHTSSTSATSCLRRSRRA